MNKEKIDVKRVTSKNIKKLNIGSTDILNDGRNATIKKAGKQKAESVIGGAFIFESYYKAMLRIKQYKKRWDLFEAIFQYSCYGVVSKILDNDVVMCFELIAPIIDKSRGKKRGNPNFEDGRPNPYYSACQNEGENNEQNEIKNISTNKMCDDSCCKNSDEVFEVGALNNEENVCLDEKKTETTKQIFKINDKNEKNTKILKTLKPLNLKEKDNSQKNVNYVDNSHMINNKDKDEDKDLDIIFVGEGSENYPKPNNAKNIRNGEVVKNSSVNKEQSSGYSFSNTTTADNMVKKERYAKAPTYEEVKKFVERKKLDVDPNLFFNYYESRDWWSGKARITDWKSCIVLWSARGNICKHEKELGSGKFAFPSRKAVGFKNIEQELNSINFDF